ncbi:hypothetical protein EVAR_53836_1 [Eumeta japonica]|uniref:Uncharacterized protein n=1 Tax=Eumeta variegata TaxID=151549 RepID=A0A4C1ZHA2_EUMVA|nr:hypothetical protein EVAR_53836_1 [Eumeta japonica]
MGSSCIESRMKPRSGAWLTTLSMCKKDESIRRKTTQAEPGKASILENYKAHGSVNNSNIPPWVPSAVPKANVPSTECIRAAFIRKALIKLND